MPDALTFDVLIRRVRGGDQDAAAELVRTHEPAIRRAVRSRLTNARLGILLDSMPGRSRTGSGQPALAGYARRARPGLSWTSPVISAKSANGRAPGPSRGRRCWRSEGHPPGSATA